MERWILWETEHTKDTHGSGHLDQTMDLAAWGSLDKGCPESCRTMGGVGLERDPPPGSVQGRGVA